MGSECGKRKICSVKTMTSSLFSYPDRLYCRVDSSLAPDAYVSGLATLVGAFR